MFTHIHPNFQALSNQALVHIFRHQDRPGAKFLGKFISAEVDFIERLSGACIKVRSTHNVLLPCRNESSVTLLVRESVAAMIALLAVLATFIAVVDGFYQAGWITREATPILGALDKSVTVPWHFNAGETKGSNNDESRPTIQIRIAQAFYMTTGIVVIISSELFLSLCSCHTHSAASLTIS